MNPDSTRPYYVLLHMSDLQNTIVGLDETATSDGKARAHNNYPEFSEDTSPKNLPTQHHFIRI